MRTPTTAATSAAWTSTRNPPWGHYLDVDPVVTVPSDPARHGNFVGVARKR